MTSTPITARIRKFVSTLSMFIADMIGLYSTLFILAWWVSGEHFWIVTFWVNMLPAMLYPVGLALLLVIFTRKPHSVALLVLPLITLIFFYGSRFIPYPVPPEASGQVITVLTYNLSAVNPDGNYLANFLQNTNTDMVAMQEIHHETADRLETLLATQYPYQIRYNDVLNPSEFEGRMLLSRYPILSHQDIAANFRTVLYLRAEINVEGQIVTVFNIHLPPPRLQNGFSSTNRNEDFAVLLSNLQSESLTQPFILMGDFNMSDMTANYRTIVNDMPLIDSQRAAGYGFGTSFPNFQKTMLSWIPSMVRLDYIFVTDSLMPLEVHVIHDGTSDHFPVWARLQLNVTKE